jgi:hypothetical protein
MTRIDRNKDTQIDLNEYLEFLVTLLGRTSLSKSVSPQVLEKLKERDLSKTQTQNNNLKKDENVEFLIASMLKQQQEQKELMARVLVEIKGTAQDQIKSILEQHQDQSLKMFQNLLDHSWKTRDANPDYLSSNSIGQIETKLSSMLRQNFEENQRMLQNVLDQMRTIHSPILSLNPNESQTPLTLSQLETFTKLIEERQLEHNRLSQRMFQNLLDETIENRPKTNSNLEVDNSKRAGPFVLSPKVLAQLKEGFAYFDKGFLNNQN